jgi:hypothetical protein
MQIETGNSQLFSDDPSVKGAQWLSANLILWKKSKDSGESEIWAANATGNEKRYAFRSSNLPLVLNSTINHIFPSLALDQ